MEKLKKRSERFGCATSPVITGVGNVCLCVTSTHRAQPPDHKKKNKRLGASSISPSAMGTDVSLATCTCKH